MLPASSRGIGVLLLETYYGRVADTVDAVFLTEACRTGLLSPLRPELYQQASKAARPGSVLILCADEAIQGLILNGSEINLTRYFHSRSSSQLSSIWWQVADPGGRTWAIDAYPHEKIQLLKRPLNDQLFSHIHTLLAPANSITDTPGLPEAGGESKLENDFRLHGPESIPRIHRQGAPSVDVPPDSGSSQDVCPEPRPWPVYSNTLRDNGFHPQASQGHRGSI
ncbi:hypothetical protein BDW59DRAFT_118143 [Aspergillus cavernicola]|uniref:Uncharacterized protein n=1 Tax=Aspergillus cavernicola TaxID=176166 RepID=A0ABR4HXN1_9EURO